MTYASGGHPLAQLRNAQLDRAGARLPHPVAIAVALIDPLGATFAMPGAGQALDLQLHQALRGKADHLAQQIGVGAPAPNPTGYLSLPKSNAGALASCSFVRSVVNFASRPTLS